MASPNPNRKAYRSTPVAQGQQGPGGPVGPVGPTGPTGSAGRNGTNATVAVGTTTTGVTGSNANVTNTGSGSNAILNFTIPRGSKGDTGNAGPAGPDGAEGPIGADGATGPAGADGTSADQELNTTSDVQFHHLQTANFNSNSDGIGFNGNSGVPQFVSTTNTAGVAYTSNEQAKLNDLAACLITNGLYSDAS